MSGYTVQRFEAPRGHRLLIFYEARPDSPDPIRGTVVFVHGVSATKESFLTLVPMLTALGYRVCTYDDCDPGASSVSAFGGTFPAPEVGAERPVATLALLADDLRGLLADLGGGPVHLVGHGLGGLVARSAVIAEPSLVRSLTLLGSGPSGGSCRYADCLELIGDATPGHSADELWARIGPMITALGVDDDHMRRIRSTVLGTDPRTLVELGRAYRWEPDRVDELAAIGLPAFVVHGADGGAWSARLQGLMAEHLGAHRAVVEAVGPAPHEWAPERFVDLVSDFWQGCAGDEPGAADQSASWLPLLDRIPAQRVAAHPAVRPVRLFF